MVEGPTPTYLLELSDGGAVARIGRREEFLSILLRCIFKFDLGGAVEPGVRRRWLNVK
jgi:hypothetical protein